MEDDAVNWTPSFSASDLGRRSKSGRSPASKRTSSLMSVKTAKKRRHASNENMPADSAQPPKAVVDVSYLTDGWDEAWAKFSEPESMPPFPQAGPAVNDLSDEQHSLSNHAIRNAGVTPVVIPQRPIPAPPELHEANWYGLPPVVRAMHRNNGVTGLYDWQRTCLDIAVPGRSLLYSMPTSGGKTLVAELLLLRTVGILMKTALFVLPYVSIVMEKAASLRDFGMALNFQVEQFCGMQGNLSHISKKPFAAVCTIEKANGLLNQMIEDGRLNEIGLIVVDELHMLGDGDRGALLEMFLAKAKYVSCGRVQIIGMSATVSNLPQLATWLGAEQFQSDWRPVPLTEYTKINTTVTSSTGEKRELPRVSPADRDHVAYLCSEVGREKSVLVFCPSKKGVEQCASMLADMAGADEETWQAEKKAQVLQQLRSPHVDQALLRCIKRGVAYHHAGLTSDEREVIEQAYRDRVVRVLTCTSTLAAGVNLPAARVIIRSPYTGIAPLTVARYRQMSGRAGRKGMDSQGESFLLGDAKCRALVESLVSAPCEAVESQLFVGSDDAGLQKIIIDAVNIGVSNMQEFVRSTLLFHQRPAEIPRIQVALKYLVQNCFIRKKLVPLPATTLVRLGENDTSMQSLASYDSDTDAVIAAALCGGDPSVLLTADCELSAEYEPLPLGRACFKAVLSPELTLTVHADLMRAQTSFCLLDELHMCYCCSPLQQLPDPNWQLYVRLFNTCHSDNTNDAFVLEQRKIQRHVAELVGVNDAYLQRRAMQKIAGNTENERIAKRYFYALLLWDLVHEVPLHTVADKFGVERGLLQTLMDNAARYAGSMVAFCRAMQWTALEVVLGKYIARVNAGVKGELVELVEIPAVGRTRARAIYSAGFKTVELVAKARPDEFARVVKGLGPFPLKAARRIIMNARDIIEKQVAAMREAAEDLNHGFAPL